MKRLLVCIVLGALTACFALFGCAGNSANSSSSGSAESSEATSSVASESSNAEASSSADAPSSESAPLAGGWTVSTIDVEGDLTDDEAETFMKAMGAQAGIDLKPIAVLATQVVSGQNIAYLCEGTPTTDGAATEWDIVVVYSDPQGEASITSVTPIDLADIKTGEATPGGAGAWQVREASSGVAMTAEAAQAFSKASENYDGVEINPLALLGTQVVAGTNYLILGTGHAVTQNPETEVYVATVYEDLNGNAEFTDVSQLDLLAYVG